MDISISKTFKAVVIMLMLRADLCSGIECDQTKQYPVRNNSSGRILKCSDCRECAAGFEPRVRCGEFIGIYESIGGCRPCQDGTYSPDKDTKACQTCQKKSCFKHQVVEGECVTDKNDTSYCVDKCVKGYSMNKEGTACNVDFPTKNTTTPAGNTATAANTTTIPTTNDRANKESRLHPGVIAAIVLVIVAIIVGLIVVLCCCYEKLRRTDIGDTKGDKDDIDSTAQLIDETNAGKKDESPKLGTEEQSFNQNGSPTANGPYLESFEGYAQNTIPLNMANNENMIYMSSSSSPANNGSVVLEMPRDTPLTIKMG